MRYANPNPERTRVIRLTPDEAAGFEEVMREALPKLYKLGSLATESFVLEEERDPVDNPFIDTYYTGNNIDQLVGV